MGDRRRGSYGNWEQRWSGKPRRHGRPPLPQGASYPSIPTWEKRFITEKCKIPWWKVCETKNVMYLYKNVIEWDDSGALEALENAKSRYWAEINGSPCDIPLPDPNMFIDEVDYDAVIDPELIAELDKRPPEPVDVDCSIPLDRPIVPTGWGDEEDHVPDPNKNTTECQIGDWNNNVNAPIVPTGWGDAEDPYPSSGGRPADFNDAWNSGCGGNCGGSTNSWSYNAGWEHWHANNNTWGNGWGNSWDNGRNHSWGTSNRNDGSSRRNGRRRDGGHAGFRSTKPRYQEDDYRTADYRGENRGRNRGHNSYNKPLYSNQPVAFN